MKRRAIPILVALFFALLASSFLLNSPAGYAKASRAVAYECEGNACSQVVLTWEDERQQFRVQNDSDRRVRIDVTTFAGDSTIRVDAHKSDYLLVKTFNGPFRANFD
jgi:hypothetical protein